MTIRYYHDLIQGSDEWHAARCGMLTASEFNRILTPTMLKSKIARDDEPDQAHVTIASLATLPPMEYDRIRKDVAKQLGLRASTLDVEVRKARPVRPRDEIDHVWELAAQRISQYVEPQYITDAMLRGHEDEITARELYAEHFAPVEMCGFVTNDKWGFTLGCSPDGLVGNDGMIEIKSRIQKFQVQTICEHFANSAVPAEFALQVQGELLVTEREWCDLISYSGGLPMVTIRVRADAAVQAAIVVAAAEFETRIKNMMLAYSGALKGLPRLVPTERKVELEMHV